MKNRYYTASSLDGFIADSQNSLDWIVGGGDLVGQFYDRDLLDEVIVTIAPVTLGAGAPLLPRPITRPPLRLLPATTSGDTFARLRYQVPRRDGSS